MAKPCIIAGCDNSVKDNSRLDACSQCRASINRWQKRSAAEIRHRRDSLNKYTARIEPLTNDAVEDNKAKTKQREALANEKLVHITMRLSRKKQKGD